VGLQIARLGRLIKGLLWPIVGIVAPTTHRRTSYLAAINGSVFMPAAKLLVRSKCKGRSGNKIIEEALFRCGIFELNVAPLRTIAG
jgi:hypothetical protein